MTDTSALDKLRIENQATAMDVAYHAARLPNPDGELTAVTSIATKQTSIAFDGKPLGRIHALTDSTTGGYVFQAESYRVPGFWCGQSIWKGDGPDGYFLDPLEAIAALIDDNIERLPSAHVLDGQTSPYERGENACQGPLNPRRDD